MEGPVALTSQALELVPERWPGSRPRRSRMNPLSPTTLFHVKLDPETLARDLSPSQQESLRGFEDLLKGPGAVRGVVSKGDLARLWPRHILDSLRAVRCLEPGDRTIV